MKSKFLQQTKAIADGTTAFSRLGFNSAKVIVYGGTDTKDIELHSGDSSGQTKLLVLGQSGGADTVKDFDVDLSACGDYIKIAGTSLTSVTVVLGDPDVAPASTNAVAR